MVGQNGRHRCQGGACGYADHRDHSIVDGDDRDDGWSGECGRSGSAIRDFGHHGGQCRHHAGQRFDRPAVGPAGPAVWRHLRDALLLCQVRPASQHLAGCDGLFADLLRPEPDDRRSEAAAQDARSAGGDPVT